MEYSLASAPENGVPSPPICHCNHWAESAVYDYSVLGTCCEVMKLVLAAAAGTPAAAPNAAAA